MLPSSLRTRTLTAAVVVAVLVLELALAHYFCFGRWLLLALAVTAVALCAFEFGRLTNTGNQLSHLTCAGVAFVPALVLACLTAGKGAVCGPLADQGLVRDGYLLSIGAGGFIAAFLLVYAGRASLQTARELSTSLFAGYVLVGIGGASLVALAAMPGSTRFIAWLFAVVAVNDIAAYFGGSKFQGPKIAPALSPNKTISGSMCGLAAGTTAGVLLQFLLGIPVSLSAMFAFSALITLSAQTGDFLKSFLKRDAGVKDSGSLLPGHGGLLDRIDGELMAGPLFLAIILTAGGM